MKMSEKPLTENGKPIEGHYSKRFCPILSIPSLAIPVAKVITGDAPPVGPHLSGCRGIACMFFVPITNEKNEVIDGTCVPIQIAASGNQLVQLATGAIERFLTNSNKKR
jgi:hypothetical protein